MVWPGNRSDTESKVKLTLEASVIRVQLCKPILVVFGVFNEKDSST